MTMWHLEREFRKSGNPEDLKRADILANWRAERGQDVPLPGNIQAQTSFMTHERGEHFTEEFVSAVNETVAILPGDLQIGTLRNWKRKKYVAEWETVFGDAPQEWIDTLTTFTDTQRSLLISGLSDLANIDRVLKGENTYGIYDRKKFDVTLEEAGQLYDRMSASGQKFPLRYIFMARAFRRETPQE